MLVVTWDENNYICFLQSCSIPFVHKSTMLTKDDIHTLVDVVIVDPTHVDLLP
jgi:hypothetical protein